MLCIVYMSMGMRLVSGSHVQHADSPIQLTYGFVPDLSVVARKAADELHTLSEATVTAALAACASDTFGNAAANPAVSDDDCRLYRSSSTDSSMYKQVNLL